MERLSILGPGRETRCLMKTDPRKGTTIIQFLDHNGNVLDGLERVDYYGTQWAEGQLSDEDEDIIEHLEVGATATINGGWSVKRIE